VHREQLPEAEEGHYYWTDLIGLRVELEDGTALGTIENLMATGANDVMVVKGDRQRLVPFVREQYVKRVDLEHGVVVVDWDPDF
jgi:16S rRNA processing protein RimM